MDRRAGVLSLESTIEIRPKLFENIGGGIHTNLNAKLGNGVVSRTLIRIICAGNSYPSRVA
jgi:hypothetical protein